MSSINSNYLILPQNCYQKSQISSVPAFRGKVESNSLPAQATQPLSYPPDTVEISAANKIKKTNDKMSTGAKVGITALGILGSFVTAGILISKHQTNKLTRLYNEKMVLQTLPHHIDFKEAKTVEDGIKFAKEVLKIGEVDSNFTLDAINYANRSITKVSNANKGKLFIPKKMHYVNDNSDMIAGVVKDIESKHFGELYINSRYFNNNFIDKSLQEWLGDVTSKTASKSTQTVAKEANNKLHYEAIIDEHTRELIKKFRNNSNSLTITEKRDLLCTMQEAYSIGDGQLYRAPFSTLMGWKNHLEEAGIKVDIDAFKKLNTEKQADKLKELLIQLQNKKGRLGFNAPFIRTDYQIYHEMGHLQDFAKNLKELDLNHWKLPSFKDAWNDGWNGRKQVSDAGVKQVDNRWGGLTYKGNKELFEKNPTKFKKRYPDLYEFLTNQEYQQAAGKVSEYAQTSIGEFIAETYARMVRGDKIPDDVMKLYKKYNGPTIPFS